MFTLIVVVLTMTEILSHVVDKYPTLEICEAKKTVFIQEFKQTYPGHQDYAFECLVPLTK